MKVFINQEEKLINEHSSLTHLLESIDIKPIGIALAVNQTVVPKEKWEEIILKENDDVILIRATQGG
ncbi:MAG: sulfur carrier protein ThiS [Marinifilaceae bacterium]